MEESIAVNNLSVETPPQAVDHKFSWVSILKRNEISFRLEILIVFLTLVFVVSFKKLYLKKEKKKYPFPSVTHGPFKLPGVVEGCITLAKIRWQGFKVFETWKEKYGVIYELPMYDGKVVALMDPNHIQKVLLSTDPSTLSKPRFLYDRVFVETLRFGLVGADYPVWSSHRKMISRAFTYKALQTYLSFMNKHAKLLNQNLLEKSRISENGERLIEGDSMFDLIYFHSLRIALQFLMGADTSCSDEDSHVFHNHFKRAKEIIVYRFLHAELMLDSVWWFHPMRREFRKIFEALNSFIVTIIEKYKEKREMERKQGTIHHPHLQEEDGEEEDRLGYNEVEARDLDIGARPFRCLIEEMLRHDAQNDEIIHEVSSIISAGHETMTIAINLFMWHLACNPEHQERCREEVDAILDSKSDGTDVFLNMEDLYNMKYMERCILEGVRMTPTIPLFGRRLDAPLTIDGIDFDAGTNFIFTPSILHMNPEYFPNPQKFDPDRFLPENVKERNRLHPYSFYPFSLGPRDCIGKKLTIIQMKITVGWILRNFEILTTDKWSDMKWMFEITLMPHKPFNLSLKKRSKR